MKSNDSISNNQIIWFDIIDLISSLFWNWTKGIQFLFYIMNITCVRKWEYFFAWVILFISFLSRIITLFFIQLSLSSFVPVWWLMKKKMNINLVFVWKKFDSSLIYSQTIDTPLLTHMQALMSKCVLEPIYTYIY